jgi:uncharacterized protein
MLFGNINLDLAEVGGKLTAKWHDTSGRTDPLVVSYRWSGSQFVVDTVHAPQTYKTSYNCSKTSTEYERAICYVSELAALDLKLDEVFKSAVAKTSGPAKETLVKDQRQWLKARDKKCTLYKWWVECLRQAYEDRIKGLTRDHP